MNNDHTYKIRKSTLTPTHRRTNICMALPFFCYVACEEYQSDDLKPNTTNNNNCDDDDDVEEDNSQKQQ